MIEWQICGLMILTWVHGIFLGWILWQKPQLDEAIKAAHGIKE